MNARGLEVSWVFLHIRGRTREELPILWAREGYERKDHADPLLDAHFRDQNTGQTRYLSFLCHCLWTGLGVDLGHRSYKFPGPWGRWSGYSMNFSHSSISSKSRWPHGDVKQLQKGEHPYLMEPCCCEGAEGRAEAKVQSPWVLVTFVFADTEYLAIVIRKEGSILSHCLKGDPGDHGWESTVRVWAGWSSFICLQSQKHGVDRM